VSQIVPERDGLGQILVQPQCAGDRARDVTDVERVGESHPVVIAFRREEHLGLVLETAERLGVHDPIAVALEARADRIGWLGPFAPRLSAASTACGESVSRSICSERSRGVTTLPW
jgi:hypothetical protein